jgi:tripartite-type tricarboxylate transporter receptor subunit TctC
MYRKTVLIIAGAIVMAPAAVFAQSPADFYRGKTVSIVVGFPAGGGYDANSRVLARHMGRFIPGNPTVVASNMPGAGSLIAANHTYNAAPKDGTTIVIIASSVAVEPYLKNPQARFDPLKFGWLGSMSQEASYCGVWNRPGNAQTWAEVMTRETSFGGGAPSAITSQHPQILRNVLRANIKVITGYQGSRDINLAMQRGEVHGTCGMFSSSIKTSWNREVSSGDLKLVMQVGPKKSLEFGDVPHVFDYAKTEEERGVLDFHFGQLLMSRPYATPPGIPEDRLAALRTAFEATMKDPEFLSEAKKAGLDIDPVPVNEIMALLTRFSQFPERIIELSKQAIER